MVKDAANENEAALDVERPLCQKCGFQRFEGHKCHLGGGITTGGFIQGIYLDARVGPVRQWALVLDCALNGCPTPHSDNGEFYSVSTAGGDVSPSTILTRINGHRCRLVSRFVPLPEWSDVAQHPAPSPGPSSASLSPFGLLGDVQGREK